MEEAVAADVVVVGPEEQLAAIKAPLRSRRLTVGAEVDGVAAAAAPAPTELSPRVGRLRERRAARRCGAGDRSAGLRSACEPFLQRLVGQRSWR